MKGDKQLDICTYVFTNTHGPSHTRLDPAVRHPEEPPNPRTQTDTKIHTYPILDSECVRGRADACAR